MTVGDAFTQLGDLLSALEANDIEVTAVDTDGVAAGESLGVDLRLEIPTDGGGSGLSFGRAAGVPDGERASTTVQGGTGTADGGDEAAAATGPSETDDQGAAASGSESEPAAGSGAAETNGAPADTDGHACDRPDCDARFGSADALTVHRFAAHDLPDEPLHRHEPALEAAYRAYDSFPRMADALGVDVTPQTVRRNMIDGGIHDPASPGPEVGSTDEQPSSEEDRAVTDGSGAAAGPDSRASGAPDGGPTAGEPAAGTRDAGDDAGHEDGADPPSESVVEGVTAATLREAVVEGGSLRAAAERLDRGRDETRELLSELGLLDLVHGRVANRPERAERREAFEAWLAAREEEPSGG
jgi:hypothetical protein